MWLDDHRPFTRDAPGPERRPSDKAFRPFGIATATCEGETFAVEERIGAHLPFGRLRTFTRESAGDDGSPPRRVLVVAPMAGGYPFLMRDLVVALLGVADEVAITDWPDARYVPLAAGRFGFGDNCIETTQMIRALARRDNRGSPEAAAARTHVVGVCQGAVPALVGALLLAEMGAPPASVSLIGGPIDPSRNPTRLWRMLQGRSLDALRQEVLEPVPDRFPGAGRMVFPAWRQTDTFALYLWRQTMSGGRLPLQLTFDEGDDPYRFPLARLCWTLMDVPGEFFMENVATIFCANALARGTLDIAGHRVEPARLERTALLTVEGEDDDISALTQTEAAHDLCANVPEPLRRHLVVPGAGHFALFYGRAMRTHIIPALAEIMAMGEKAR